MSSIRDLVTPFSRSGSQMSFRASFAGSDDPLGVLFVARSHQPAESQAVTHARGQQEALCQQWRKDLEQTGGALVFGEVQTRHLVLTFEVFAEPDGDAASALLHQKPGLEAQWLDIRPGQALALILEVGDHVILPLSRTDEQDLRHLWDLLDGFPTDEHEALVQAIRRPALDARVRLLEEAIRRGKAGPGLWRRLGLATAGGRGLDLAKWLVPFVASLVACLGVLALLTLELKERKGSGSTRGSETMAGTAAAGAPAMPTDEPGAASLPQADPQTVHRAALEHLKQSSEALADLFNKTDRKSKNPLVVLGASYMKNKDRRFHERGTENAYFLFNLIALKHGEALTADELAGLALANNFRKRFKSGSPDSGVLGVNLAALLGWQFCGIKEATPFPGLRFKKKDPGTKAWVVEQEVPFGTPENCTAFDNPMVMRQVEAGLAEVLLWVRGELQPGGGKPDASR